MTEASPPDTTTPKRGDQLPEDGPKEVVPDDVSGDPERAARRVARERAARETRSDEHSGPDPEMPPAFDPKVPR